MNKPPSPRAAARAVEQSAIKNLSGDPPDTKAVMFDDISGGEPSLSKLKRMQDPDKFSKARFSFRLYKR